MINRTIEKGKKGHRRDVMKRGRNTFLKQGWGLCKNSERIQSKHPGLANSKSRTGIGLNKEGDQEMLKPEGTRERETQQNGIVSPTKKKTPGKNVIRIPK